MTQTVYFTGVAYWAKLEEPDQKYQYWGLDLALDDESKIKFEKSGLTLKVKKNTDGVEVISLRRPVQKLIKGELVDFEKPKLVDKDNNDYVDRPLVGIGSFVTCKVLVYNTLKGPGHRLEAVRVDQLVEYKAEHEEAPF